MTPSRPALTSSTAWRVLAAGLTLAGALSLIVWADGPQPADPGSSSTTAATSPDAPGTAQSPQPPRAVARTASRPLRVTIPAIKVSSALVRLGRQRSGEVEVPQEPLLAGWYAPGTVPGAVGSAVILGHVDSTDGPAVFARLSQLVEGDRVRVVLADGSTAVFTVRSARTYANDSFPARLVYGSHGRRELNLITCGGDYDADRGGYQANVVVNARWVSGARS